MVNIGNNLDLPQAILLDVAVLTLCVVLLLRYGRLSHSHPGSIYLFFHVYTFTFRLLGIWFGANTLFSSVSWMFEPVRIEEIVRAAVYGDIALVVMTIAWIRVSVVDQRKSLQLPDPQEQSSNLSLRHIWTIV